MTHSLMLLISGLAMVVWRPCRNREGRAPRLAVALLLTSFAAVWLGSFGVMVGLMSGRLAASAATACGVVWRQLLAGQVEPWQLVVGLVWFVALPLRGGWSLARDVQRNRRLLRTLRATGTMMVHPVGGPFLVVPDLVTPAVTLGLLRPVIAVDARFWVAATVVQRDVVVAHEQGHVRGRHGLVDACARLLTAGLAPLPSISQAYACLRRHLEAMADDAAVRRHDRRTVGQSLGNIALAASPSAGLGASGASLWRVQRLVTGSSLRWTDLALLWSMLLLVAVGLVLATAEIVHALGPAAEPTYCLLR